MTDAEFKEVERIVNDAFESFLKSVLEQVDVHLCAHKYLHRRIVCLEEIAAGKHPQSKLKKS